MKVQQMCTIAYWRLSRSFKMEKLTDSKLQSRCYGKQGHGCPSFYIDSMSSQTDNTAVSSRCWGFDTVISTNHSWLPYSSVNPIQVKTLKAESLKAWWHWEEDFVKELINGQKPQALVCYLLGRKKVLGIVRYLGPQHLKSPYLSLC